MTKIISGGQPNREGPRRNGYVGIVIREPGRNVPLQAVNGRCSRCSIADNKPLYDRIRARRHTQGGKTNWSDNSAPRARASESSDQITLGLN